MPERRWSNNSSAANRRRVVYFTMRKSLPDGDIDDFRFQHERPGGGRVEQYDAAQYAQNLTRGVEGVK